MQRPNDTNPNVRAGIRGLVLAVLTGIAVHLPMSPLAAQAQREVPRSEPGQYQRPEAAQEAMDQLKSPYCPGLMLEVCPSPGGAALRDSLNMLAEEGWSSDQLVDWVLANHGDEWLALPRAEGRSLIAWLVPPLGLLLGVLLVVVALRRMREGRATVEPLEEDLPEEVEARLREAMRELDAEEEATFF
ncbi:MAG TPA: cytochrome c-type biogenesis protein CcmH [Longimicrobiales bacterium]|nr:cytochrome c-type biogenesis protein CcmH [Longimicrobiales bacterium]